MNDVTLEGGPGPDSNQEERSFSKSGESSSSASDSEGSTGLIYQGPVYHIGVNRLGHHFCHLRFLRISGMYVEMFKKDPASGEKPIRRGIAGRFLKVEDLGRRKVEGKDLYVLKISNALSNTTKGEIALRTALDAQNWRDAFLQAKDEADAQFHKHSGQKLTDKDQFKLNGHRPRLRHYAKKLTKIKTIGRDSDYYLGLEANGLEGRNQQLYASKQDDDIVDEHDWRCVRTVNGIRILEDASSDLTEDKLVILKSEGVIEASSHAIFEMLMDITHPCRREWDILTGDLKLIQEVDGHCDIVYGTFDPKYLRRGNSKSDFVFKRVWRHDPDNTYSILQSSTVHKDCPKKSGFRRITLNPTFWEIKPLASDDTSISKSRVSQIMEIRSTGWGRWKHKSFAKLDKTVPYVILCQIAGLRDYFAANPGPGTNVPHSGLSSIIHQSTPVAGEFDFLEATQEEFYDAIATEVPEDEEDDNEKEELQSKRESNNRFRNTVLALMRLTPHARAAAKEFSGSEGVEINLSHFHGSLPQAVTHKDTGCWTDPGGEEFMVRGKTYPFDDLKISGGEPLLKLLAVDWFYSENRIDSVSSNHNSIVQSEAGKRLPFILIVNLQVPATPNYSLVFYFGAEKPISKGSLLDRFVNGSDAFRDSRFKLIPRITKGYWFVKRAVGSKACLLGQAVTCRYVRQCNFLEIDVDIGSSSVARSIINLVLKHVTSLVVDMAILIEGREEAELPEYLLGTTRVIQITLESATLYQ